MNKCPICSDKLLRHWLQGRLTWQCMKCRQEMPNFENLHSKNSFKVGLLLWKSQQIEHKRSQNISLTSQG